MRVVLMYVCLCVCMLCMYLSMYVRLYIVMYVMYICTYVCYVYMYVCMLCIYVRMFVMYICTYVCIHMRLYTTHFTASPSLYLSPKQHLCRLQTDSCQLTSWEHSLILEEHLFDWLIGTVWEEITDNDAYWDVSTDLLLLK